MLSDYIFYSQKLSQKKSHKIILLTRLSMTVSFSRHLEAITSLFKKKNFPNIFFPLAYVNLFRFHNASPDRRGDK